MPRGLVGRSITPHVFIAELDRLATSRGYPAVLRCDNGPELARDAMTDWASNLAKKICTGGDISYQIGYTPTPNPCTQYTAPATTTG